MSKSQDRRPSRQHGYQGDMHEQLGNVLGRKLPPKPTAPLMRAASSWQEEGVDHINIDAFSKTDLGKWLEFGKPIAFKHAIFDMFNTVLGFWFYIRSLEQPDILRRLAGKALREYGQKYIKSNRKVKHLKAMVLDAAYQRIRQSAGLYKLFHENELPFDSYRTNAMGVRIRNTNHEWIIPGYMEIQRAIHGGVEPDFSPWCDGDTTDIYESVRPAIPVEIQERLAAKKSKPAAKQGKPKKEGKPQVLNKVRREDYVVTPETGYCPAIPLITIESDEMFLPHFRTTARVNGEQTPTGPVYAGLPMPILALSHHPKWAEAGLINEDDVLRAFPITDQTFRENQEPQALLKMTSFVLGNNTIVTEDPGGELTYVPVNLKTTLRSYEGQDDRQTVEDLSNKFGLFGYRITREITVYKAVDSIFTQNGQAPEFLQVIRQRFQDHELASALKFILIKLKFESIYSRHEGPEGQCSYIHVTGSGHVVGMSTGTYENRDKVVVKLEEDEIIPNQLYIAGYTYSLARGRLKPALVETAEVIDDQNLDEEIRRAFEKLPQNEEGRVVNDQSDSEAPNDLSGQQEVEEPGLSENDEAQAQAA